LRCRFKEVLDLHQVQLSIRVSKRRRGNFIAVLCP
jgi:hypothetical protein